MSNITSAIKAFKLTPQTHKTPEIIYIKGLGYLIPNKTVLMLTNNKTASMNAQTGATAYFIGKHKNPPFINIKWIEGHGTQMDGGYYPNQFSIKHHKHHKI